MNDVKHHYFGSRMVNIFRESKGIINGILNKCYKEPNILKSGENMTAKYRAIRFFYLKSYSIPMYLG